MEIRPATAKDIPDLVQAALAMAEESEGTRLDPGTVTRGVTAGVAGNARYFIADDGGLVGCLFVTREWSDWNAAWYWWIQGAYVVPERRGQGVYKTMYHAVRAAAGPDVHSIRLYVEQDNPARTLYAGLGMQPLPYTVMGHRL